MNKDYYSKFNVQNENSLLRLIMEENTEKRNNERLFDSVNVMEWLF